MGPEIGHPRRGGAAQGNRGLVRAPVRYSDGGDDHCSRADARPSEVSTGGGFGDTVFASQLNGHRSQQMVAFGQPGRSRRECDKPVIPNTRAGQPALGVYPCPFGESAPIRPRPARHRAPSALGNHFNPVAGTACPPARNTMFPPERRRRHRTWRDQPEGMPAFHRRPV